MASTTGQSGSSKTLCLKRTLQAPYLIFSYVVFIKQLSRSIAMTYLFKAFCGVLTCKKYSLKVLIPATDEVLTRATD